MADDAIKLRAEHPDWTPAQIIEESKKGMDKFPLEEVLEKKKPFFLVTQPSLSAQPQ